jgi:solute carrier family 25 S-adenosylmethionine transporter 26
MVSMTPRIRGSSKWTQHGAFSNRLCYVITLFLALHIEWSSARLSSDSSCTNWRPPTKRFRPSQLSQSTEALEEDPFSSATSSNTRKILPNRWRAGSSVVQSSTTGLSYYARVALAGGLAGATGTCVLYPMDSAKTLRQSNPAKFASVRQALWHLIRIPPSATGTTTTWQFSKAYRGWLPAALGAIPSSALYFGAYESSKRALEQRFIIGTDNDGDETRSKHRWWIHGLAAASGNTISSAIFVPKEVLKQQLQYQSSSSTLKFPQVFLKIVREQGVGGLYTGYQATLMRNIPSAMIRFILYEELKQFWSTAHSTDDSRLRQMVPAPVGLFAAGAVAGACASGFMTPIDVIKTRLATGTCPVGVQNCFRHVIQEMGWRGLYAGTGSRMMWSGAFSAIGFGTFELVKGALGVADTAANGSSAAGKRTTKKKRTRR